VWGSSDNPIGDVEIKKVCPYCNGTGKIKHPAITWAEKEEK
jgi:DnaJ-class molecular chaperone